jgi:ATP-binding cassette subfamily B protein
MKGRTVLAIAHRLSTVAKFDQLVVLREGRIVEQGTPTELRRRRGLFYRMCRLQEEGPMQLAS